MTVRTVISTPRGAVVQLKTKAGEMKAELLWNPGFGPEYTRKFNSAQAKLDSEVMRLLEPYMQLDTGAMIMSMRLATTPGHGEIIVNTPYARRVYYSNSPVGRATGPLRGPYYFPRMVADKRGYLRSFAARTLGAR